MVSFKNVLLSLVLTANLRGGFGQKCELKSRRGLGYNYRCSRNYGCTERRAYEYNLTCIDIDGPFSNNYNEDEIINSVTFVNKVAVLSIASFAKIPLFSNLYMHNLDLEVILPGAFNSQHNLSQIYLNGNRLSNISDGIFNSLTKLRVLNLAWNRIDHITPNAFLGTRLEEIYLNNNNLSDLNSKLFNFQTFLNTLDLSFNNLKEINGLFRNLSITNLNVSSNRLIDVDIRFVLTIENLNLSNNQIKFIKVDKMNRIRVLDISKNKMSTLDDILNKHLEVLIAGYNLISEMDNNTFRETIRLRELHLNNNNLSSMLISTFKNLHNLQYLNLSSNHLSSIVLGTFDSLQNLLTLDISNNEFKTLPYALHTLYRLENCYFQYNEISDMNVTEFLQHKPNLCNVQLDNNKWHCNKLMDIVSYFKHHNISIIKGNDLEASNIYGIRCEEDKYVDRDHKNMQIDTTSMDKNNFKDFKVNLETFTNKLVENQEMFLDKLSKRLTIDQNINNSQKFMDSTMYKFFNEEFRNSSFVRYLESLSVKNKPNLTENPIISTESIDRLTDKLEKNQETFTSMLIKLEKDFNSKIVTNQELGGKNEAQFLDKLTQVLARNQEIFLSRSHGMSITDYKKTDGLSGEAISAKYTSERSSENNDVIVVFIVLLSIGNIVTLIGLGYLIFFRKQNIDEVVKRDVELSQLLNTRN